MGAGRPCKFCRVWLTSFSLKDVMALFCLLCPKALYSVASKRTDREAALRVVSTAYRLHPALSHALSDRCSAHVPCICLKKCGGLGLNILFVWQGGPRGIKDPNPSGKPREEWVYHTCPCESTVIPGTKRGNWQVSLRCFCPSLY